MVDRRCDAGCDCGGNLADGTSPNAIADLLGVGFGDDYLSANLCFVRLRHSQSRRRVVEIARLKKEIGADSRGIARQRLISAVTFLTLGNRLTPSVE